MVNQVGRGSTAADFRARKSLKAVCGPLSIEGGTDIGDADEVRQRRNDIFGPLFPNELRSLQNLVIHGGVAAGPAEAAMW